MRIKAVRVICAEPAQMYFRVESSLKSKCPQDASSATVGRISIPNYEATPLAVIVKDAQGRRFDNISSLAFLWAATPPNQLSFQNPTHAPTQPLDTMLGYIDTGKG